MPVTADPLRHAPPAIHVDTNGFPWSVASSSQPLENGSIAVMLVVKATYSLEEGGLKALEASEAVKAADAWAAEPGLSNLDAVCELSVPSMRRQYYVQGAVPIPSRGNAPVDVGFQFRLASGEAGEKWITLTPPARWQSHLGFRRPRFETWTGEPLPLDWSLAYGGVCPVSGLHHPENPAGRGFRTRGRPEENEELPCFHPPGQVWTRPAQATEAVGLSALPVRREGDVLRAPEDQCLDGEWQVGDEISLQGLTGKRSGEVEHFVLPAFQPQAVLIQGRHAQPLKGRVDTLTLDTTERHLNLLWRSAFTFQPCVDQVHIVIGDRI